MIGDLTTSTKIIQVGPGPFDKIGIHRITKNICGCQPTTFVLMPGSNSDFDTSFQKME